MLLHETPPTEWNVGDVLVLEPVLRWLEPYRYSPKSILVLEPFPKPREGPMMDETKGKVLDIEKNVCDDFVFTKQICLATWKGHFIYRPEQYEHWEYVEYVVKEHIRG